MKVLERLFLTAEVAGRGGWTGLDTEVPATISAAVFPLLRVDEAAALGAVVLKPLLAAPWEDEELIVNPGGGVRVDEGIDLPEENAGVDADADIDAEVGPEVDAGDGIAAALLAEIGFFSLSLG